MGLEITGIINALEQGASLWHLYSAKYNVGGSCPWPKSVGVTAGIKVKLPEKSRFQHDQAPAASISRTEQCGTNYCHAWNALVAQWGSKKDPTSPAGIGNTLGPGVGTGPLGAASSNCTTTNALQAKQP